MRARRGRPEAELQSAIIGLAHLLGYRVAHFRPARVKCYTCGGGERQTRPPCRRCGGTGWTWRTPVEADGAGFPDLFMVRPGRAIMAEVKIDTKPTPEQQQWLEAAAAGGIEAHVFTLRLWRDGTVERVLRSEGGRK